MRAWCCG
ncbi:unnamed protein product [Acanthoscelides obtectus]|nr:unnamed protein product [Acanthoscelides obtectus]CAK1659335.1 hypothetical protein AOBTE_LOCUS21415 [Acanthoscelides obtectus]